MRNYLSRVKVSTGNVFKLRFCRSRRRTTAIVDLSQPPPPYRRFYFQNQTLPVKYTITRFLTITRPNNKPALQAVSLINFLFSFSFSLIKYWLFRAPALIRESGSKRNLLLPAGAMFSIVSTCETSVLPFSLSAYQANKFPLISSLQQME